MTTEAPDGLEPAVRQLSADAVEILKVLRRRTRWFVLTLAVVVLVGGAVILDNRHKVQQLDRDLTQRTCALAAPFIARPGDPPPVGDEKQRARSQGIRDDLLQRYRDFGCRF